MLQALYLLVKTLESVHSETAECKGLIRQHQQERKCLQASGQRDVGKMETLRNMQTCAVRVAKTMQDITAPSTGKLLPVQANLRQHL